MKKTMFKVQATRPPGGGVLMLVRCPKHPRYKALRAPTAGCAPCQSLFELATSVFPENT